MFRRINIVLFMGLMCVGCTTTEQPSEVDPLDAAVLAFAEPILKEQFPDAYKQHQPFTAEAIPNTVLWEVHPVSGVRTGVPVAAVRVGDEMQIQSYGLQK